jgi:8-oxo-dGTP pyrophosphatase MutT (NUDIX family)
MNVKNFSQFINEQLEARRSAGLAITYDGKVLLAHTTGRKFTTGYGIPKGGIESGESELDAAIRETSEEIGVKINKSLVDKTPYTFTVTSRKYKYTKIVTYFIVALDSLDQINVKDLVLPKGKLQLKEINDARFLGLVEAKDVIMPSQTSILTTLVNRGLLS